MDKHKVSLSLFDPLKEGVWWKKDLH
jgi:hypothetical protein